MRTAAAGTPRLDAHERRMHKARRFRDLLHTILVGAGEPGRRLPDELELSRRYGVSRNVIRDALALLAHDGRVSRRVGMGSFVDAVPFEYPAHFVSSFTRITTDGDGDEPLFVADVLAFDVVDPLTPHLRDELGFAPDMASLAIFERIGGRDGRAQFLNTYLIPLRAGETLDAADGTGDLYGEIARRFGRVVDYATRTVSAIAADSSSAALLAIAEGSPLLHVESFVYSVDGNVMAVNYSRNVHDALSISFRATRADLGPTRAQPRRQHRCAR